MLSGEWWMETDDETSREKRHTSMDMRICPSDGIVENLSTKIPFCGERLDYPLVFPIVSKHTPVSVSDENLSTLG